MIEYGNGVDKAPGDSSLILTPGGIKHSGNGLRIDLDNYRDLICWLNGAALTQIIILLYNAKYMFI